MQASCFHCHDFATTGNCAVVRVRFFLRSRAGRGQLWAMSVASSRASEVGQEIGLRGQLAQFGLATVLTFLDLERRSGELVLLGAQGVGRLWLLQGRVVRARIEGSRRTRKAAVYELLGWNEGHDPTGGTQEAHRFRATDALAHSRHLSSRTCCATVYGR